VFQPFLNNLQNTASFRSRSRAPRGNAYDEALLHISRAAMKMASLAESGLSGGCSSRKSAAPS